MYGSPGLTADSRTESDWILVSANETGTGTENPLTSIVFHRKYDTLDPNIGQDYLITEVRNRKFSMPVEIEIFLTFAFLLSFT